MAESIGICVAVLAAGKSRRMGTSKLTMAFAGSNLLDRAIRTALQSSADRVFAITGAHQQETRSVVSGNPSVIEVHNPRWQKGQSTSVVKAIEYAQDESFEAVLIMLGDQPFVKVQDLERLMEAYRKSKLCAYVSRVADRDGSPCLFGERCFNELLRLKGDEGARKIYRTWAEDRLAFVLSDNPYLFHDIDTLEDAYQLEEAVRHAHEETCGPVLG